MPNLAGFAYDNYGNLTQNGARTITYGPYQPHLPITVDSNQYHYDLGRLSGRTGPDVPGLEQTIEYTNFDLPSKVTTGGLVTTLEYTADEQRVIRRDASEVRYFVGGLYQRRAVTGGATQEERFRLYAGSRLVGEIVRTPGSSDQTLYVHSDDLDSVDTLSADGGFAATQTFAPFGDETSPLNPELTRAGFTGQDHDRDLGLIDMHGRIYYPLAGQFCSPDPILQAASWSQGLNRYAYAFNDPINNTDPSGYKVNWSKVGGWLVGGFVTAGWIATVGIIDYQVGGISGIASDAGGLGGALGSTALTTPGVGRPNGSLPQGQDYSVGDNVCTRTGACHQVVGNRQYDTVGDGIGGGEETPQEMLPVTPGEGGGLPRMGEPPEAAPTPTPRGGENSSTALGRWMHRVFADEFEQVPGWRVNPRLVDPKTNRTVIPDAMTPEGNPVELKPDTPSGRAAGRRAIAKYERAAGMPGIVIHYDPTDARNLRYGGSIIIPHSRREQLTRAPNKDRNESWRRQKGT
jgi:RHS repeat-associated protein